MQNRTQKPLFFRERLPEEGQVMGSPPPIELYRKYIVEDSKSKLTIRVVMTSPTRKFSITLHRLRVGRHPHLLEKEMEKYLEDHLP
jgi:hypothetical protein